MTTEYVCEHGIRSGLPFVHIVGPTTTADGSLPVPPCHPELVEGQPIDILSPDCRDGKCAACVGDAWDDDAGQGTDCQHACHDPGGA